MNYNRHHTVVFAVMLVFFGLPLSIGKFGMLARTDSSWPTSIHRTVDEHLSVLKGNTHPLARPDFDAGAAPPSLPMKRMLLVLKRSPEAEAALDKLLDEQLDPASKNFHNWITPEQFGRRFGLSDRDIHTVTSWLAAHGFEVAHVSKGRTVVEVSGTAGQVSEAFHTQIHKYVVRGEQHWANSTDPKIPAFLTTLVAGVDSLHDFPKRPMVQKVRPLTTFPACGAQAGLQSSRSCYGLGPYDFATIYNVLTVWSAGLNGSGQSIAILSASNINIGDVREFRQLFGLPAKDPDIVLNGPNPGITNRPQSLEKEAITDVEWSGAVAPGATIRLIVSASTNSTSGFDLSAEYAVDNDVAPILSGSYAFCEATLGVAGNEFHNRIWQQAAAEGITVVIGTGDGGSADCDYERGATPPAAARSGLSVNGVASTPFNLAVGGTDFSDLTNAALYWNPVDNSTTHASAKGYIPETTWNDSCTNAVFGLVAGYSSDPEANCNNRDLSNFVVTSGGGGGRSSCIVAGCAAGYPKPSWQAGVGVPTDGVRDIPDLSLFSGGALSGSFYLICEADLQNGLPCTLDGSNSRIQGVGGTSISAPAFAGIMGLILQNSNSRQGNANAVLYKLADQQSALDCSTTAAFPNSCVFHDVTSGTIVMPCIKDSPACVTTNPVHQYGVLSGYGADVGYDLATGLGSPDAFNLVTSPGWTTRSRWITDSTGAVTFSVPDRGAVVGTTAGSLKSATSGYAGLTFDGSATASGIAIMSFRADGAGVSETSVSAVTTMKSGRIYAEIGGGIDIGLALVNPNSTTTTVSFFFTDANGQDFGNGNISIAANGQLSRFLSESPFNGSPSVRAFTFEASGPIAVTALRGRTNERSEVLFTTLPVIDLSVSPYDAAIVPHMAQGGGWTTQVLMVNPGDVPITGRLQFSESLSPSHVFNIAPRSSIRVDVPASGPSVQTGWMRIIPDAGSRIPSTAALLSFRSGGVMVTEAGIPVVPIDTGFRLYVEASTDGNIQTGIAIMNPADVDVAVTLALTNANGSPLGTGVISVPANGQISLFLNQVAGLSVPSQGIVRISAASPLSVIGLRGRYNERNDFLITSLPPVAENLSGANGPLFFPQFVDGGGYVTQFIIFGTASSGGLQFRTSSGALVNPF
jgi:hypothetical protein